MGTDASGTRRKRGWEAKAAIWGVRHPGVVSAPAAVTYSGVELGWLTTGSITGGAAAGLVGWYRAHPATFDRFAAPRVRSAWRRWSAYLGPRWANAMRSCELTREHPRTGEERVPRIIRVRSHTPHVDTIHVKICPGQHARTFEQALPELAEALRAERVAVERVKPLVIALIVQRREPFTETITAPDMVDDPDAVDLSSLYVGDTEYGDDLRFAVTGGNHTFIAGATGAGKNSIPAGLLRGIAPAIRDGLVRLWICDPKQLEFSALEPIAHRYASDNQDCADLVDEYVQNMEQTQRWLSNTGNRKVSISRETPLDLLILDELGALLAYGDAGASRALRKSLALVGSQGRATGHTMLGLVQEPTKDTVPVRELFTVRVCLRVTSDSHVDMVLGDGARLRGALADEIPNDPATAGIGYVIRPRTRVPMRFRAAYVTDEQLQALVRFVDNGGQVSTAVQVVT